MKVSLFDLVGVAVLILMFFTSYFWVLHSNPSSFERMSLAPPGKSHSKPVKPFASASMSTQLGNIPSVIAGRYAACFTGAIRSGSNPLVYSTLRANLFDQFESVDSFFYVDLEDHPRYAHKAARALLQNDTLLYNMLLMLNAVAFEQFSEEISPFYKNESCVPERDAHLWVWAGKRLAAWKHCFDIIKEFERRAGFRYDGVFQLRPDIAFLYPLQGRESLDFTSKTLYSSMYRMTVLADQLFIMSRDVADIFYETGQTYVACQAVARKNMENVVVTHAALHGVELKTMPWPLVVVREKEGAECFRLSELSMVKQCYRWYHQRMPSSKEEQAQVLIDLEEDEM